jgi:hypothetical protein
VGTAKYLEEAADGAEMAALKGCNDAGAAAAWVGAGKTADGDINPEEGLLAKVEVAGAGLVCTGFGCVLVLTDPAGEGRNVNG